MPLISNRRGEHLKLLKNTCDSVPTLSLVKFTYFPSIALPRHVIKLSGRLGRIGWLYTDLSSDMVSS